jgi:hypothetical protein
MHQAPSIYWLYRDVSGPPALRASLRPPASPGGAARAGPLTNPLAEPGMTLQVVGVPAPAVWRSAEGLAVFGPRSFGFDVEYRPLDAAAG